MAHSLPDTKICADGFKLSTCSVLDEDGNKIQLRTLWEKQPAILIFLRHFACDACRKHAVEVWEQRKMYEGKGARIHFIGNGAPHFMKQFKEQYGLEDASFFTDPTLNTFNAAGFRRGFWIDPGEMHSRSEFLWLATRYAMRKTGSGNVWQLGGVLVICPGGVVKYQFISQMMGEFAPSTDIPKIIEVSEAKPSEEVLEKKAL